MNDEIPAQIEAPPWDSGLELGGDYGGLFLEFVRTDKFQKQEAVGTGRPDGVPVITPQLQTGIPRHPATYA